MANSRCLVTWMVCSIAVFALSSGCETMPDWNSNSAMSDMHRTEKKVDKAEAYRTRYLTKRDSKALDWILKNRLYSGMSRATVAKEFGEDGQYQESSKWLKATGGTFRTTDEAYKWGPDENGRSVYLIFRDDVLVNFDPKDFELGK